MNTQKLYSQTQNVVKESYKMAITLILFAFTLATALAWNDAVKSVISSFIIPLTSKSRYQMVYAVVITLVTVLIFTLFGKATNANVIPSLVGSM